MMYLLVIGVKAQEKQTDDEIKVMQACLGYLDGLYQGDSSLIKKYVRPNLHKFGYIRSKETGGHIPYRNITYKEMIDYSKMVDSVDTLKKTGEVRRAVVLDISNHIAAAKVEAWWGTDYILLSRQDDYWIIDQVIWEQQ
ncbi:nuclear transport factor 2 family protein [Flagellimonas meishanensis]|uniref:nuclear transport factor 2 family protein n=1 Tax=Flagellimonas meishanensis TaxID=2873264 RepID=UPI001CA61215|nr:nuclear transport factor 2 family protein [[Muricauda] meishanensis]